MRWNCYTSSKSMIKFRAKSVLMFRNSFIYTARSLRAPFNYTLAPRGWGKRPAQNPEGPPLRLLFLTPTRSNRIIDGIKRRSVWVSFKQRLVGARARSWGIVTSLGRWSSKTSSRLARSRVSTPVHPTNVCTLVRVCAYSPGWLAGRWAAPQLYWATSYYDNAAVCADPRKAEKGEMHLPSCFAPRHSAVNFLLAKDKNTLDREWRLVVSPIRTLEKKNPAPRKTLLEQTRVWGDNDLSHKLYFSRIKSILIQHILKLSFFKTSHSWKVCSYIQKNAYM